MNAGPLLNVLEVDGGVIFGRGCPDCNQLPEGQTRSYFGIKIAIQPHNTGLGRLPFGKRGATSRHNYRSGFGLADVIEITWIVEGLRQVRCRVKPTLLSGDGGGESIN